jgi:hypothetical protein
MSHWEIGYQDGLNNRNPATARYLHDSIHDPSNLNDYCAGYRMGIRCQPEKDRCIEGDLIGKPKNFEIRNFN